MFSLAVSACSRARPLCRAGKPLLQYNGCHYRNFSVEQHNFETVSYLVDSSSKCEVYLVGTAHVSAESAQDVKDSIELASPSSVMVELCSKRASRIRSGETQSIEKLVGGLLGGSGFGQEFLLKAGLTSLYSLLRLVGMDPGLEFKVALEEADRRELNVCYADRDVDETVSLLHNALSSVSWSRFASEPPAMSAELQKIMGKVGFRNLAASVELIKNRRHISLFRDHMEALAPELMEVMLHQRDRMMVDNLLQGCCPGVTVAVVGMAHMDGIELEWQRRGGEVFLHTSNSLRHSPLRPTDSE